MQGADSMLILLFLLLAYGGPFLLGYLYFSLRHVRRETLPLGAPGRTHSPMLPLLCVATLLLAYGLGHLRVLSYPGAIMLSMVLGVPAFFLSAARLIKVRPPVPEEGR